MIPYCPGAPGVVSLPLPDTTYQCLLISAHQCHLSVSISAAYQCP
ncbi:unnamed protein product, partial [Staurois parvus]